MAYPANSIGLWYVAVLTRKCSRSDSPIQTISCSSIRDRFLSRWMSSFLQYRRCNECFYISTFLGRHARIYEKARVFKPNGDAHPEWDMWTELELWKIRATLKRACTVSSAARWLARSRFVSQLPYVEAEVRDKFCDLIIVSRNIGSACWHMLVGGNHSYLSTFDLEAFVRRSSGYFFGHDGRKAIHAATHARRASHIQKGYRHGI
jgi:hypothetical protein